MARSPRSELPEPRRLWNGLAAAALLLVAPFVFFQAAANAGADVPAWARAWNGFRLADEARGRLTGDPEKPENGLTVGPGAQALARAAFAREPLATDALFVLALAQAPLTRDYRAGAIARQGAALDKRSGLLQLLMIADAASREDFDSLFEHADLLAAAHPDLANAVLAPLFARLADPASVPLVARALARDPRWAGAFKSTVPADEAALGNYFLLRRRAGPDARWQSDAWLISALVDSRRYADAFALWREIAGPAADRYGFATDDVLPPIGWRLADSGERTARIGEGGAMTVWMQGGTRGELARQLLELPPGRYRLETRVESDFAGPPLEFALQCAAGGEADRKPLTQRTEFVVGDGGCPAYWLRLNGSALDTRHDVAATLGAWRFSRLP